jgi:hypothetical protein
MNDCKPVKNDNSSSVSIATIHNSFTITNEDSALNHHISNNSFTITNEDSALNHHISTLDDDNIPYEGLVTFLPMIRRTHIKFTGS